MGGERGRKKSTESATEVEEASQEEKGREGNSWEIELNDSKKVNLRLTS